MNNKPKSVKNSNQEVQNQAQPCNQCESKGYIEIRDCGGEIQRTETCSYCEGTGYLERSPD